VMQWRIGVSRFGKKQERRLCKKLHHFICSAVQYRQRRVARPEINAVNVFRTHFIYTWLFLSLGEPLRGALRRSRRAIRSITFALRRKRLALRWFRYYPSRFRCFAAGIAASRLS
jgi:hypothetical protein